MLNIVDRPFPGQLELIHVVESDDLFLEESDVIWFRVLRDLDWRLLLDAAVQYYEALWHFNRDQSQEQSRKKDSAPLAPNPETREQARQRLLHSRCTLDPSQPILATNDTVPLAPVHVNPDMIRPGHTPLRLSGRAPKDFFAMLKAFLGVMIMGRPGEPEFAFAELSNNPAFARTCGFTLYDAEFGYRASDVPSQRKLEQFDQIMTANGLWGHVSVEQVRRNLESGVLESSTIGVHDTTHYHAFSSMEVPVVEGQTKNGKPLKKSHPRTTKGCRCPQWEDCRHPWISADEGAGTVVKAGHKMYWAHKCSTFALSGLVEIPLDAVAMMDAASHDSRSLVAHLERIEKLYPRVMSQLEIVLDDSALDDQMIRKELMERFGLELIVEPNHRGRKAILSDLPRGIDHITGGGTPVCQAGFPFDLLGSRRNLEQFLFRAPNDADGIPVCTECPQRSNCIRSTAQYRHLSIPFARLPFIDQEFPHLSKLFKRLTAKRTVIERVQKLMKFDYGDDRLSKRGTPAYQAILDKTLFAMHVVLAIA